MQRAIVCALILCTGMCVSGETRPVDLCDLPDGAKGLYAVRGVGKLYGKGILLFDTTCPAIERKDIAVPKMLVAEPVTIPNRLDAELFAELLEDYRVSPFQVVLYGNVACQRSRDLSVNSEGGRLRGSGFGTRGVILCSMNAPKLIGIWRVP